MMTRDIIVEIINVKKYQLLGASGYCTTSRKLISRECERSRIRSSNLQHFSVVWIYIAVLLENIPDAVVFPELPTEGSPRLFQS